MTSQKPACAVAHNMKMPPSHRMRLRNSLQIFSKKSRRIKTASASEKREVERKIYSDGHNNEKSGQKPLSQKILRFRKSERLLHWAIAVPFLVCYITALILMIYYNGHALRPYREFFSVIHRISGACLIILPLLVVIFYWREYRVYLDNLKEGWRWRAHDLKWLVLSGPAAICKKIKLPDQDKYNAAEKINFMTLTATYPLYIATGLFIWLSNGSLLSWFIHIGMALYATPLLIGHKFMATINPGTRVGLPGMFSGYVDREWAKHHYARWYWKHFGSDHKHAESAEDHADGANKRLALTDQAQGEHSESVSVTPKTYRHMSEEVAPV